jgi:hypothetical protein
MCQQDEVIEETAWGVGVGLSPFDILRSAPLLEALLEEKGYL